MLGLHYWLFLRYIVLADNSTRVLHLLTPKIAKHFWTKEGSVPVSRDHIHHRKAGTLETSYNNVLAIQSSQELYRQGAETAISLTTCNGEEKVWFTWVGHSEDTKSIVFSPFAITPLEPLLLQESHVSLCCCSQWLYYPGAISQLSIHFTTQPSFMFLLFRLPVLSCLFSIILLHPLSSSSHLPFPTPPGWVGPFCSMSHWSQLYLLPGLWAAVSTLGPQK